MLESLHDVKLALECFEIGIALLKNFDGIKIFVFIQAKLNSRIKTELRSLSAWAQLFNDFVLI